MRPAARLAWAAATLLRAAVAVAQPSPVPRPTEPAAPPAAEWEFSASTYVYVVPEDRDYASATVTGDRGAFHLEARYNYEGLDTGSLWAGANFEFGKAESVTFEITPMVGGVFGHVHGVAPAYHLTIGWKRLELYSEGEYLFDTDRHDDSFFYAWNELTYSPLEWLQAGLVSQRTRAYQTPLDIQRGFLVRGLIKNWTLGFYVFNLGWTDPTFVFSVGLDF
ncbi:MAG TPA: hypothetical protein VGK26_01200 [Thermoanaerobaculia bacterium]